MATATKKGRAARPVAGGGGGVPEPAVLEFLVYGDNGGGYHWEIVGDSGETLAQSVSFATHDDAERAARYLYDRVGSARFEPHGAEERQTANV